jgi:acetyl-CoA C-acetyltransferase
MALNGKLGVIGCAQVVSRDAEKQSLEETLYDVALVALKDAGLTIDDIDGIVVAGNDQIDGRAISVMMASGSVGGVDRDILSTPSASEHAFVMGALRVASGHYRNQLVIAWSPTEAVEINEVERLGADPYFHRRLPLDETSSFALQANAILARVSGAMEAADRMVVNRRGGAGRGRWPLTAEMLAPPIAGAVALVLASDAYISERGIPQVAWVRGMGWATEPSFLGDRDLAQAPALTAARKQAYEEATITSPAKAFDVVEICGTTPYQELLALEGLGLSARNDWLRDIKKGAFAPSARPALNPSGGTRANNTAYCAGLMRIAEAANQIRGRAGNHQLKAAKTALAHAASGFAMQYQTVVVFDHAL